MKIYFAKDINKRFSNIVSNYLNKGYIFNCGTMSGSQGEISKVHLVSPDRTQILNIRLESVYRVHSGDTLELTTSVYKAKANDINILDSTSTLWNSEGTEVQKEIFYSLNGYKHNTYCDKEYLDSITEKRNTRYNKDLLEERAYTVLPERYHKILLPLVKRLPKCKSAKLSDIQELRKYTLDDKVRYWVKVRNVMHCINDFNARLWMPRY